MKRLFVNFFELLTAVDGKALGAASPACNTLLWLSDEDSHYLRDVLRVKVGDELLLFDRGDSIAPSIATVESLGGAVAVKIIAPFSPPQHAQPVKTLLFALCKGERNDLIAQKATELGVERVVFWQADRSVLRLSSDSVDKKQKRWLRIAESAAEQSAQASVPEILVCEDLYSACSALGTAEEHDTKRICCSLSPLAVPLHECIVDKTPLDILIGPEGDISPREEDLLCKAGFCLVSLGPSVLRSETAAIVAVAMTQALWRAQNC